MSNILKCTASLILVLIIGYLLVIGRNLLIPVIIALFTWNLLNTLSVVMQSIPLIGSRMPKSLSMLFSLLVVAAFVFVVVAIITSNVNDVIDASSRYQVNLTRIFALFDTRYHIKILSSLDVFLKNLDIQKALVNIYAVFTTVMGSSLLIALYVVFLFIEQHFFKKKMALLFPRPTHRKLVHDMALHIARDTQTYLGLKTLLGLATAFFSWVIMKGVGLDFAEFWALLIFFLGYIPNVGAIIATGFPALLALVQFQSGLPFIIITTGIVIVQFIIGNLVEPHFLGEKLNLSPFVILLALGLWGMMWGVIGMFLSVPITVVMMIIFSHFNATRPIAILLSQDGNIKTGKA